MTSWRIDKLTSWHVNEVIFTFLSFLFSWKEHYECDIVHAFQQDSIISNRLSTIAHTWFCRVGLSLRRWTKQVSCAFSNLSSAYRECIEWLPPGHFVRHTHVLPQTNAAEFQILLYLCPVLRTWEECLSWFLQYKDNKLLSICRDFKSLDDFISYKFKDVNNEHKSNDFSL